MNDGLQVKSREPWNPRGRGRREGGKERRREGGGGLYSTLVTHSEHLPPIPSLLGWELQLGLSTARDSRLPVQFLFKAEQEEYSWESTQTVVSSMC